MRTIIKDGWWLAIGLTGLVLGIMYIFIKLGGKWAF